MPRYDRNAALVVVDVQNDFAHPDGSLYVQGGDEVVATVNAEVVKAVAGGSVVVYTQDWHPESTPHFQKDGGIWPVHCVGGTWGSELHPRLLLAGRSIRKGTGGEDGYSGFTVRDPRTGETASTGLAEYLRERGVRKVTVVGLALDYCVKDTALDAASIGYVTEVLLSATAPVEITPEDGTRAVAALNESGVEVE